MNIKDIKQNLLKITKHWVVPFLWGAQGVGKTQTIKQLCKENDLGFVHLHLATQEVGDLVGLLIKNDDGTVKHARPEWFPTQGKGIIFLDEFNRAHPDVLQCMFSFLNEGTIHQHKLPDGWRIVAAGNYQSNSFNVTDVSDAALISRFCHIDFRPEIAEFVAFAELRGAESVASFIRDNPTCLEVKIEQGFDKSFVQPNRRAMLDMIGALETEDLGLSEFEIYTGCIGTAAASAFMAHKKKKEKGVSINDVLKRYEGVVRDRVQKLSSSKKGGETRFDVLNSAIDELFVKLDNNPQLLDENKLLNLQEFLLDIPLELSMKVFNWMKNKNFDFKDKILNDKNFVDRVVESNE